MARRRRQTEPAVVHPLTMSGYVAARVTATGAPVVAYGFQFGRTGPEGMVEFALEPDGTLTAVERFRMSPSEVRHRRPDGTVVRSEGVDDGTT
ncbi:hypothetical protein [Longivirga aurantiaca]|uniref:Uncharacterized protein n=1 Tax=Longivirga aurantiaca TaxID=1837743 RepID=A0ABW1T3G9_9ACTN